MNSHVSGGLDTQVAPDSPASVTRQLTLEPSDSRRLANLNGLLGQHLRQIEERLHIEIRHRGNHFELVGAATPTRAAEALISSLYRATADTELTPDEVHLALQSSGIEELMEQLDKAEASQHLNNGLTAEAKVQDDDSTTTLIRTKKATIKPRGLNQQRYVRAVQRNDINFGIGPAGTGKTYLAVACAVESLLKNEIERILLVRPAVEAGEKLGFLPGDLTQKVDPYLRPLYDALYEMLGFEAVGKLIERGVIEIAPLAFMRGRTLNNSFVILDESQNTTREQMKMFLTRIGFGTTAVITGDPTQIDLPRGMASGLRHAIEVLDNVHGISFTHFTSKDVVRHPIVQRIVEAYDAYEENNPKHNGF
ncbi:PhoH family protein [Cellvibrio japonicus]|uniref:PhoH-like protein n=1 Tax=Cellvibrio japonicus (strain Ueda107) TaxID=498211 RepID=B3PER4_CELJU|nr:PhoH-like protein [Cellvibrio japonicus Ueda107]